MSPLMHNAAIRDLNLDFIYLAFNISPKYLNLAVKGFKTFNFVGINITMPFKQNIMNYLDEVESLAQKIGAVNTIKNENGYLIGMNTDGEGAIKALKDSGYSLSGKNVLVLGAGGAARAIVYMMAKSVNKIVISNRTQENSVKIANEIRNYFDVNIKGKSNSYQVLKSEVKKADIIINTTPIGSYPNIEQTPIPSELLHKDLFIYDIVYNPIKTRLMKESLKIGCKVLGGLDMLVNQGALAFKWWTGLDPNKDLMKTQIIKYLGEDHAR